jgi:hypothetical protein
MMRPFRFPPRGPETPIRELPPGPVPWLDLPAVPAQPPPPR